VSPQQALRWAVLVQAQAQAQAQSVALVEFPAQLPSTSCRQMDSQAARQLDEARGWAPVGEYRRLHDWVA
jgi:hypothetical protein